MFPSKARTPQGHTQTSGKMRIKPKSTLEPVFIYHWALLPWVGQKASTSHRGEYVSVPPTQCTAREAPASPGFVGTTSDHPEGQKPRKWFKQVRHTLRVICYLVQIGSLLYQCPSGLMVTSNETKPDVSSPW